MRKKGGILWFSSQANLPKYLKSKTIVGERDAFAPRSNLSLSLSLSISLSLSELTTVLRNPWAAAAHQEPLAPAAAAAAAAAAHQEHLSAAPAQAYYRCSRNDYRINSFWARNLYL